MMAISAAYLRGLPVTASVIYLGIGLAVGPAWLDLLRIDFLRQSVVIEHITEVAVIISLFIGGLKLRLPLRDPAWSAPVRLAGPVMLASIASVAAFTHWAFGMDWPTAVLLGAVLAPTDPVLAGMVSVNGAQDQDRMRYGLSGEAGLNDGAAFPFVVFGLMWLGQGDLGGWAAGWAAHRLLWAVPVALALGYAMGKGVGMFAIHVRSRNSNNGAPGDFLALALIALSYASAEAIGAWGFLAVFAAGLGFRKSEVDTVAEHPAPGHGPVAADAGMQAHPPAEELPQQQDSEEDRQHPTRVVGHLVSEIITFGDTAERLLEVMLVVVLGICLYTYWDWRAVPLALCLFVAIRPLASLLFLVGTRTRISQRWLMGWFGIRGVGSLYYLAYALNHGASEKASDLIGLALSVVALSVLAHGITSPVLDYYEKRTPPKAESPVDSGS